MLISLRVIRYTCRLLLAVIIGITLLGLPPVTARAAPNPVDLQLGGVGATSWSITNVKPTDQGSQIVELQNIGTQDGFVTIWISDIISSEGANPESETGNTSEPGEFADYLLLNLTAPGLVSSLNLPVTIYNLPQSANGSSYIAIMPVKAGNTVILQWNWELPAEAGNDVQGDEITFTLNYLLREVTITSLAGSVTANGTFTETVTVQSDNNQGQLTISQGTTGRTKENLPLSEIWLIEMDRPPPAPPPDKAIVGLLYESGPDGATFDQPLTITLSYDPGRIPQGGNEEDLTIGLWDNGSAQWLSLPGSTVDTVAKTVSAPISHFSRYTVLYPTSPPPPPPPPPPGGGGEGSFLPAPPLPPPPLVKEKPELVLEANILGNERIVTTETDGSLLQALLLADPDGNFVIEFSRGTKITDSDGRLVTRIELTIIDDSPAISESIIILSPKYRLAGYINQLEVPLVIFNPAASLSIRYDTRNLPENIFPPFIADYSADQGLERLLPAPGAIDEIGRTTALIDHSSLFFVAAEILPPPPPLPARFEAHNMTINPRQVYSDQAVTISFSITNRGDSPGTYEIYLVVDGIVRAIEEISLSAMSSQTFSFEVANLSTGIHQVKVAGLTGAFEVALAPVLTTKTKVNWFMIDISVIAALLLGALALYIIIRRTRQFSTVE